MKNRRLNSLLMVIMIICSMFLSTSGIALGASMEGAGTKDSPYLIRTVEDLYRIPNAPAAHYKLMNDLDLENIVRSPMASFQGVFDGNQFTITNMHIVGSYRTGLFQNTSNATFKDLVITNSKVEASNHISGLLVGYASYTTFTNCSVLDSEIYGKSQVGLICGTTYEGLATNCFVKDSYVDSYSNAGALFGHVDHGSVLNCYSTGGLVKSIWLYSGGLIGHLKYANMYQCFTTTDVYGEMEVGGLVGITQGKSEINQCFARNTVKGRQNVGAFLGTYTEVSDCSIINSYSMSSSLCATENEFGGVFTVTKITDITNCYSASKAVADTVYGMSNAKSVSNSYFDKNNTTTTNTDKWARTTEQMYQKSNYEGWDFENVWMIDEGNDYPRLQFESNYDIPEKPQQPITRTLKVVLELNEQLQLTMDDDVTVDSRMTWISSTPFVASVSSDGIIKAAKTGNTIITGYDEFDNEVGQIYIKVR